MNRTTMTKRLSCLLMALLLCLPALFSCAETRTKWSYQFEVMDDGTAKITEYRGSDTELIIPEELDGYPVTAIGDGVFQLKQKLISVVIPNGVVSIGAKAFSSCDGIQKITLPKSLKTIGNRAFSNCKGLTQIVLPEGLEQMGENPFALCDNLTDVSFSGPNAVYEVRDGALINKQENRLVSWLHQADQGAYTVPDDIRIIGRSAFVECKDLTSVTLPEGLEIIEESAFNRCTELDSITLPESLAEAQNQAFANCERLSAVSIPDNLASMPGNPFMGCTNLTEILISENHSTLEMKDGVLFDRTDSRLVCYPCSRKDTEYTVPEGTVRIGASAFENCKDLIRVTVPDSVESIDDLPSATATAWRKSPYRIRSPTWASGRLRAAST